MSNQVMAGIDKAVDIANDQIADIKWDELSDSDSTELKSTISDFQDALKELRELQAANNEDADFEDDEPLGAWQQLCADQRSGSSGAPQWAHDMVEESRKEAKARGSKAYRNETPEPAKPSDPTRERPGKDGSGKWVDWGIEYNDNPPKDEEYYRVRAEIAERYAKLEFDNEKQREDEIEDTTVLRLHGLKVKKAREKEVFPTATPDLGKTVKEPGGGFKIQQWYTVAFWALMIYPMMALHQDWEHGSNTFLWAEDYGQQLFFLTWFKVWLMAVIWRIPKWFEMFDGQLDDYYEGRFGTRAIVFIIDLPFIIWMVITVVGWIISLFKDD